MLADSSAGLILQHERVCFTPVCPTHPGHEIASRQMDWRFWRHAVDPRQGRAGPVRFDVARKTSLWKCATSLGGVREFDRASRKRWKALTRIAPMICFAFPLVWKIRRIFWVTSKPLLRCESVEMLRREYVRLPVMRTVGISIICKTPEPGKSKTRLSPPLSPEQCASLSECFIQDLAEQHKSPSANKRGFSGYAVYTPVGSEEKLRRIHPGCISASFPQCAGDLGCAPAARHQGHVLAKGHRCGVYSQL